MLYKKNREKTLSPELFREPTSEYRGTPFWAWNCRLEKDELLRQLDVMKEMGFGGAHMHVRTGLDTPYLSDEFFEMIGACIDKSEKEGMLAWLYDEDRWPSGAAGGIVTKDEAYRQRTLLFTKTPYQEGESGEVLTDSSALATRTGNGKLLARYAVRLNDRGELASYRRLAESHPDEPNPGEVRDGSSSLARRVASTTLSTTSCFALPFVENDSIATRGSAKPATLFAV